jgi:hypothetical protein
MVQFPHQGVLDINVLNPDFWYTLEVSKNQHRGTVIPIPTDSDQEKVPEKEKKRIGFLAGPFTPSDQTVAE